MLPINFLRTANRTFIVKTLPLKAWNFTRLPCFQKSTEPLTCEKESYSLAIHARINYQLNSLSGLD